MNILAYQVNGHNVFEVILVCFFASILLVPIAKIVSVHINAMDYPDSDRKIHKVPTPRLGGLAVFLSFLLGYILFAPQNTVMLSILIGSFLLILMGIVDSINPIKARYQLIVHIIASAIVCIYGNLVLNEVTFLGLHLVFPYPLNYILTIFFIVAFINVLNLIDGLDGLSSGIASIYFATIAIIAIILNQMGGLDVTLSIIMLGAILGFLVYNFPPATIFLGNDGSDFIGFIIGVTALLGFKATTLTSLVIPVCIMAIPIFDTAFAIIRRLLKGKAPFTPDKEHFHHQFLKLKFSPRTSLLIIYLIDIAFASISIFYVLGDSKIAMFIYIILMLLLIFLVMKTNILFEHHKKKGVNKK